MSYRLDDVLGRAIALMQGRLPQQQGHPICELDMRDLMSRFGSPLFIVDAQQLDRQASALTNVFRPPRYRLYYAIKANPRIPVVRHLVSHGLGCDATGIGDVEVALAAGCSPAAISVTGVGFSSAELEHLVSRGLHLNLDSIDELQLFCAIGPGGTVGLRINTGVAAGFHPHVVTGKRGGKLGIDLDDLPEAIAIAQGSGVVIRTLHTHLGSLLNELDPFIAAFGVLLRLAVQLPSVTTVNLGGGFGIPYEDGIPEFPIQRLEQALRGMVDAFHASTGRALMVALEPGEFLVGATGYLAATVRVTKPRSQIAIVDASANLLPAVLLYDQFYDAVLLTDSDRKGARKNWTIYGRTNQGGERLAAGKSCPLQRGDIVVFSMVGAYTSCRASQFNQIPRPAEIMVDRGHVEVARTAEDYTHVLQLHPDIGTEPTLRRAGTVRLDTQTHRPGLIEYRCSVDGEKQSLSIKFPDTDMRLDERESQLMAGVVGALLAQLVLAERLDFEAPLPAGLVSALRPCLRILYDVRSYCDSRPLFPLPQMQKGVAEVNPAANEREHGDGTLVAISGGFDSTMLLHLATLCGERVEAVHFRINEPVQEEEESAARAVAEACGVPLHIVDISTPGLVDLGRRHSTSFGRFPRYNSVTHGRDLLLIPLAAIVANRLGIRRVSFGFDREARFEQMEYRGSKIHRNDFASAYGFDLVAGLLRGHLDSNLVLEAPLWAMSGYRIRRMVFDRLPELAAKIQTCYWNRWCEQCVKCVTTAMLQADSKQKVFRFRTDILDDSQNQYLQALVDGTDRSEHLPYWELAVHGLDRLARAGQDSLWVRRFSELIRTRQPEVAKAALHLCEALDEQALVERFGASVKDLIEPHRMRGQRKVPEAAHD